MKSFTTVTDLLFFKVLQDSIHVELSCIKHLFNIWSRGRTLSSIKQFKITIKIIYITQYDAWNFVGI